MTTERIHFRLIMCPECSFMMCWVNPRLPTYCPECGKLIYHNVRGGITISDSNATLTISDSNATLKYTAIAPEKTNGA